MIANSGTPFKVDHSGLVYFLVYFVFSGKIEKWRLFKQKSNILPTNENLLLKKCSKIRELHNIGFVLSSYLRKTSNL